VHGFHQLSKTKLGLSIAARDGAAAAATVEPPTSQAAGDKTVPPLSREEMLERIFLNVLIDQDGNEVPEEDKDSEITEQARDLRKLDQYQQDIIRLQSKRDQLLPHAVVWNGVDQTQRAIRQAEIQRNRLQREIQALHGVGP